MMSIGVFTLSTSPLVAQVHEDTDESTGEKEATEG